MKQAIKNSSFVRDTRSRAVINTESFEAHQRKKVEATRLDRLEGDVKEMKQMLHMLMAKL